MKILLYIFLFSLSIAAQSQEVKVYPTYDEFEELLQIDDGKIYVVNFWATWCKPCVQELPYFEKLHRSSEEDNIEVILVTLDFGKDLEKRVLPFLKKGGYTSKVVLLDDGKPNKWIDRVDPSWSGAIPATVFYQGNKKVFMEQEFHSLEELQKVITTNF